MSATCYYCGWWTDINGVCVCGYSGKPTTRSDSCVAWKPQTEIVTNADRIRTMTDEELAEFISNKARTFGEEYEGYMSALDWLQEAAE